MGPAQNVHAPAVMAALRSALARVIPVIVNWYTSLKEEDRWLFAGVKVGWEAAIGWNAYYYPDGNARLGRNASRDPCLLPGPYNSPQAHCSLNKSAPGAAWGMVQIGYAAARSAGLPPSGPGGALVRADIAALVAMYLGNLTQAVLALGLPPDRLYTHLGGTMVARTCTGDPGGCDADTQTPHIPFSAGVTGPDPLVNGTLGVSVYARPPAEQPTLPLDLARLQPEGGLRWAAVEWGLGAFWAPPGVSRGTAEAWVAAYNATLGWGDCRLLNYHNWVPGGDTVAVAAARTMLAEWRPPEQNA